MKKIIISTCLTALLLILGTPLFSSPGTHHFTFRVPVELKRIPAELNQWRVWVEIWSERENGNPGTGLVARAYKEFALRNGAYAGTLTLTADCEPGGAAQPEHANRYSVALQIKDPRNGQWTNADFLMRAGAPWPHDPNHPFNHRIERKLTQ